MSGTPHTNGHDIDTLGPDDDGFWDYYIARATECQARERMPERPVLAAEPAKDATARPTRIRTLSDIDMNALKSAAFIVADMLERGECSVLYGLSQAGKTFLLLNLVKCLALGTDFFGRRVEQTPTLYVQYEGIRAFDRRMLALAADMSPDNRALFDTFVAQMIGPPVLAKGQPGEAAVNEIIAAARELEGRTQQPVGLVVIDTMSKALGGESYNDDDAITRLSLRCQRIADATGAHVVVVHHPGRNETTRAAGSYQILGGFVGQIHVDVAAKASGAVPLEAIRSIHIVKNKDGPSDVHLGNFRLRKVQIAENEIGEPVTSLIVEPCGGNEVAPKQRRKLPPQSQAALDVLHNLYTTDKARHVPKGQINGVNVPACVRMSDWRATCRAKGLTAVEDDPKKKAEAEKKAFGRARDAIEAAGIISTYGDEVWLTNQQSAKREPAEVSS